jgi:hypothetical protein
MKRLTIRDIQKVIDPVPKGRGLSGRNANRSPLYLRGEVSSAKLDGTKRSEQREAAASLCPLRLVCR